MLKYIQTYFKNKRKKKIARMIIKHPDMGVSAIMGGEYIGICSVLEMLTRNGKINATDGYDFFIDLSNYYFEKKPYLPITQYYWFSTSAVLGRQKRIDFLNEYIRQL